MESFIAFLIKLSIVFAGSTTATLIAFFIGKEMSKIPSLLMINKVPLLKKHGSKSASSSGFYEILYNDKKSVKVFSSPRGIKLV